MDTQHMTHDDSGVRFFRGVGYGLAVSLPFWALVGATIWKLTLFW